MFDTNGKMNPVCDYSKRKTKWNEKEDKMERKGKTKSDEKNCLILSRSGRDTAARPRKM